MTKASPIPNGSRTLNDYADRYMHLLTSDEWKVLSYTVRRAFRFQAREGRISLTQYQRGARGRDGGGTKAGQAVTGSRAFHSEERVGHSGSGKTRPLLDSYSSSYSRKLTAFWSRFSLPWS